MSAMPGSPLAQGKGSGSPIASAKQKGVNRRAGTGAGDVPQVRKRPRSDSNSLDPVTKVKCSNDGHVSCSEDEIFSPHPKADKGGRSEKVSAPRVPPLTTTQVQQKSTGTSTKISVRKSSKETPSSSTDESAQDKKRAKKVTVEETKVAVVAPAASITPAVVAEVEQAEKEEEEFNPYQFMRQLPPYDAVKNLGPKAPMLPAVRTTRRNSKRATLVLDLDETLVHCTIDPIDNPDHVFPVNFNNEDFLVYVRKRPGLDAFLSAVSGMFEVVVFTASQRVYAETLLNVLDPQKRHIQHRLYRDACLQVDGNFLKDLNVLGRDLSRVAIVDNSPYAYGYQISNGIPIESWFDDAEDEELAQLLPLLQKLANQDDVRPTIQQVFKTHDLVSRA